MASLRAASFGAGRSLGVHGGPRTALSAQGRFHAILVPREFTGLDAIVDLVFAAAEEVQQQELETAEVANDADAPKPQPKFHPVAFHPGCVSRLETHLATTLLRRSRSNYANADDTVRPTCSVSKVHDLSGDEAYRFGDQTYYFDFLEGAKAACAAFGCGYRPTPSSSFRERIFAPGWMEPTPPRTRSS